jgi:hypothetical protein
MGRITDHMSRNFQSSSCVDQATLLMLEDEALPPEEMAAVYAHLDGCRACQMLARELAGWRRTALAFAGRRAAGSCPEAGTLGAFAEGTLAQSERPELITHLASCGHCAADLAALVSELQGVEGEAQAPIPTELLARARELVPARAVREPVAMTRTAIGGMSWLDRFVIWCRGASFPVAAAAAVALILLVQIPTPIERLPATRSPDSVPGTSRIVLAVPADGGTLNAAHRILSWEALPGADTYKVTVVDETGGMVWSGETIQSWIECPLAVPFVPGARYAWWVTSGLESGERARSSVQRFVYEP